MLSVVLWLSLFRRGGLFPGAAGLGSVSLASAAVTVVALLVAAGPALLAARGAMGKVARGLSTPVPSLRY